MLRETIAAYASNLHGRDIGIDRITVTGSGMNAIMMISEALMSAGDNMVAAGPVCRTARKPSVLWMLSCARWR